MPLSLVTVWVTGKKLNSTKNGKIIKNGGKLSNE